MILPPSVSSTPTCTSTLKRELASDEIAWLLSLPNSELRDWLSQFAPPQRAELIHRLTLGYPSLTQFVREAWAILEPGQAMRDGWHIEAICRHLEHATVTPDYKLIVNIPPGCMKSLLVSVCWQAWVWGPFGWPESRWIGATYTQSLSTDFATKLRDLISSEWYQARWGHVFKISSDQNQKMFFQNDRGGWRRATTPGGGFTGIHPDFVVADDPHNVKQAESDVERQSTTSWWSSTVSTRGVARGVRQIIIMQRLHETDLCGVLANREGWDRIILPMRFEAGRMQPTVLGWTDPRTTEGELLFPSLFSEPKVRDVEIGLGSLGVAGQLQQRPAPPGGSIFKREWFRPFPTPPRFSRAIRYWDKAGTADGGDYTVGVLIGEYDKRWFVMDVARGQWDFHEREQVILNQAKIDARLYPDYQVYIEQEPGSGGKESAARTIKMLAGFRVKADKPTGPKETRWQTWAAQLEAGNVWLCEGDWNQVFIDEHLIAPNGKHDDQIDAAAACFNMLASSKAIDLEKWLAVI